MLVSSSDDVCMPYAVDFILHPWYSFCCSAESVAGVHLWLIKILNHLHHFLSLYFLAENVPTCLLFSYVWRASLFICFSDFSLCDTSCPWVLNLKLFQVNDQFLLENFGGLLLVVYLFQHSEGLKALFYWMCLFACFWCFLCFCACWVLFLFQLGFVFIVCFSFCFLRLALIRQWILVKVGVLPRAA